jgi:hypothetical protein
MLAAAESTTSLKSMLGKPSKALKADAGERGVISGARRAMLGLSKRQGKSKDQKENVAGAGANT